VRVVILLYVRLLLSWSLSAAIYARPLLNLRPHLITPLRFFPRLFSCSLHVNAIFFVSCTVSPPPCLPVSLVRRLSISDIHPPAICYPRLYTRTRTLSPYVSVSLVSLSVGLSLATPFGSVLRRYSPVHCAYLRHIIVIGLTFSPSPRQSPPPP